MKLSTEKMAHLTNMCRSIARKYKNPNEYEDMVSEAMLVCVELLEEDPTTTPITLYREANRAVYDYLNFNCRPVSIPASHMIRRLARNPEADVSEVDNSYSKTTVDQLRALFSSSPVELDDIKGKSVASSEDLYMEQQKRDKVAKAMQTLTDDEQLLFHMRFVEGMSAVECGDFFGLTHKGILYREGKAVEKIRGML